MGGRGWGVVGEGDGGGEVVGECNGGGGGELWEEGRSGEVWVDGMGGGVGGGGKGGGAGDEGPNPNVTFNGAPARFRSVYHQPNGVRRHLALRIAKV